jgi:hypothetical protein
MEMNILQIFIYSEREVGSNVLMLIENADKINDDVHV